jgi:hypothetical protein
VRPVVAPAVAVLLAGAGLAALWQRQWCRLAGLCAGFAPAAVMPLHNWYYGGVFVLFSANAEGNNLHMRPADYGAAIAELMHLDFAGPKLHAALVQLVDFPVEFLGQWQLAGPIGYGLSAAVHIAAVVVAARVCLDRRFDPWLRLTAGATLAQHSVALFYGGALRYFFLSWLLTMLVAAAWCAQAGLRFVRARAPRPSKRFADAPLVSKARAFLGRAEAALGLHAGQSVIHSD